MGVDPIDIETSAFAGLPASLGHGRGVIAAERDGLGIARVAARRGQAKAVADLLRAQFGVEPPGAPRSSRAADVRIAGIGPETWFVTRERGGNAFADSVRSLLGGCASIADQSDAYVILRLAGPKVRETLAKVIPIDIHGRVFRVNDVAQTVCGYISVMLWRLEDTASGNPTFEIWAGRSFAVSLHRAISHGAAEFGFMREPPGDPPGAGPQA